MTLPLRRTTPFATCRAYDNVRVDLDSDGTLWIGSQRSSTSGEPFTP